MVSVTLGGGTSVFPVWIDHKRSQKPFSFSKKTHYFEINPQSCTLGFERPNKTSLKCSFQVMEVPKSNQRMELIQK